MTWDIEYYNSSVEAFVLDLPPGLLARYLRLTDMMLQFGSNLGMPHTRAMSDGLFALRVKGKEGIARVFYCTLSRSGNCDAAWIHQKISENTCKRIETGSPPIGGGKER